MRSQSSELPHHACAALMARWAWYDTYAWYVLVVQVNSGLSEADRYSRLTACEAVDLSVRNVTAGWVLQPQSSGGEIDAYLDLLQHRLRIPLADLPRDDGRAVLEEFCRNLDRFRDEEFRTLSTLVDAVLRVAVHVYRSYEVDVPLYFEESVHRSVDWTREKPQVSFESEFVGQARVGLGCDFPCCGAEATKVQRRNLELVLAPAFFDPGTRDSLAFVLMHECVIHVMESPYQCEPGREPVSPDSSFAEGWMDRAALAVLEVAVGAGTSGVPSIPHPAHHDAFLVAGMALFKARHRRAAGPAGWDGAARRLGVDAARMALRALHTISMDPRDEFLRLSVAINSSSLGPLRRDLFVEHVVVLLNGDGVTEHRHRNAAVAALSRFTDDGDVETLMAEFADLATSACDALAIMSEDIT